LECGLLSFCLNRENFLKVILKGNASYQLYFIPTLWIFYLFFPLFHKIYKVISGKWVLLSLLIIQVWFLYKDYFVKILTYADPIRITILGFFFFIIGMVAAHNKEKIHGLMQRRKYLLLTVMIFAAFYVFWEGKNRYYLTGNYLSYYSQWRPSVLVYTLLVGIVFFHIFEKPNFRSGVVEKLSALSFFVFFAHVAVLEAVWNLFGKNLFNIFNGSIYGRILFDLVFFGIVTVSVFFIAYFVHKEPKLSKLTG
jgi:surface polysaccharide O-acyltransferase-like enzyme